MRLDMPINTILLGKTFLGHADQMSTEKYGNFKTMENKICQNWNLAHDFCGKPH